MMLFVLLARLIACCCLCIGWESMSTSGSSSSRGVEEITHVRRYCGMDTCSHVMKEVCWWQPEEAKCCSWCGSKLKESIYIEIKGPKATNTAPYYVWGMQWRYLEVTYKEIVFRIVSATPKPSVVFYTIYEATTCSCLVSSGPDIIF